MLAFLRTKTYYSLVRNGLSITSKSASTALFVAAGAVWSPPLATMVGMVEKYYIFNDIDDCLAYVS